MFIETQTALPLTAFHRSKLEIDQALRPTLQKIRATIQERLHWLSILLPVSKKVLASVGHQPGQALCKFTFCAGAGYIIYLLTRGVFAGIEVDNDSHFANLFSSNQSDRLTQGLNLTNGDQAGQFFIDIFATGYVAINLIARSHYHEFAREVIIKCYRPYLAEILKKIQSVRVQLIDNEENDRQHYSELWQAREEINGLYRHMKEDLKIYGKEPMELLDIEINEEVESNVESSVVV
jgi:hypothetical protein